MKAYLKWCKAHPSQLCAFMGCFVINGIVGFLSTSCTVAAVSVALYFLLLSLWVLLIWLDHKKAMSVLLALSLIALPAKAQGRPQEWVYLGCAVVVVVVGTVVTIKLKKFCDQHYKKATNSTPEEFFLSATDNSDMSAAVDNWFCAYCTSAPDVSLASSPANHPETIIEGTIVGGNISLTVVTNIGTYSDFVQEMSALGLPMQPGKHYARNGRPANQWDTPILFPQDRGEVPHVIVNGDNPKTTVVFRSFDLSTWTPILTNTIPAGMISRFEDNTTSASAFYRVTNL